MPSQLCEITQRTKSAISFNVACVVFIYPGRRPASDRTVDDRICDAPESGRWHEVSSFTAAQAMRSFHQFGIPPMQNALGKSLIFGTSARTEITQARLSRFRKSILDLDYVCCWEKGRAASI
jgi:hypothetical protein